MKKGRILIVEDEPIVALGIRASLGALGYEVAGVAPTAERAIRAAREQGPDLVLMDIHLGAGGDGVAAAERISSESGIPVVFLSAYADEETLRRAKTAGPFGYLQKPFQDKDLHLVVEMALLRNRLERKLNETMAQLEYQRGFFEAVFEASPGGILVIDAERRVHAANRVLERMFGVGTGGFKGRDIGEIIHCVYNKGGKKCGASPECDACKLLAAVTAALSGGDVYRNRARIQVSFRGKSRLADLLVSARRIEYREQRFAVLILEDVTELSALRRKAQRPDRFAGMVGRDPLMQEVFDAIRDVAPAGVPVLVLGESGTGKELVARAIHDVSGRAGGAFVPVNCGALPESLLESELFGHVRGAFTGAVRDKKGRFELADGGTIFLDEIGDLTQMMQVKLLRVLQEGTFERVGDEKTRRVDVRVVSATHKNLREEVAAGRFRDDLFYRLCVVPITLPPLRERRGDIPLLCAEFLKEYSRAASVGEYSLGAGALEALMKHAWPGNVRELQNVLQYAAIKARGPVIGPEHLPPNLAAAAPGAAAPGGPATHGKRHKLTRAMVEAAVREAGGNHVRAASQLGISRATLYRALAKA